MRALKSFNEEWVLCEPDLTDVYRDLRELSVDFAASNDVQTAKTLANLLLSQYNTPWQRSMFRCIYKDFERAGLWPDAILPEERRVTSDAITPKWDIPEDPDASAKLSQTVIRAFTLRFQQGRKPHMHEGKSIKQLISIINKNTKMNSQKLHDEAGWDMPETFYVEPPATEDEIRGLEQRLGLALPSDFKEFLRISNGFGPTWNGILLKPKINQATEIVWSDGNDVLGCGILPIEFHDEPSGIMEMARSMGREWDDWPKPERSLHLGHEDIMYIWMLPPDQTKRVVKAYNEAMNHPAVSDDKKRQTRNFITSKFGSWEAFEALEWVVVEEMTGELTVYGSFTTYLERRALQSEATDNTM
jgi:hypothetical protein